MISVDQDCDLPDLPQHTGMGRQIAFFFGSGISYATGMPQVAGITKSALEDEWHLQTLQRYLPGPNGNPNIPDLTTPKVQEFLHSLSQIAKGYIADTTRAGSGAPPHYEDLYSLAEQARRVNEDHVPNLAVVPLWRELEKETKELHSKLLLH